MRRLEARFARWISRPRGLIELVAATFGVALVIAAGVASQRAYFEGLAREKYRPPTGESLELARALRPGGGEHDRVERSCGALYEVWMQAERTDEHPNLPAALAAACPAELNLRLERTFAAGNEAQRRRAAELLARAPGPALAPALELGLTRARTRRDPALRAVLSKIVLE